MGARHGIVSGRPSGANAFSERPEMRLPFPVLHAAAFLVAGPAAAHTGHLSDLGGHDHWALGLGLGVIVGAAVIGWLKGGRKVEPEEERDAEEEAT